MSRLEHAEDSFRSFLDFHPFGHWFLWATVVLVVLSVFGPALYGLVIGPFFFFPFRLFLPLYLSLVVVVLAAGESSKVTVPGYLQVFLLVWMYAALSVVWAIDSSEATLELIKFGNNVIVLSMVFWTARGRDRTTLFLHVLAILGVIGVSMALFEIVTGWHHPRSDLLINPGKYEGLKYSTGWYYNRNDFSLVLSVVSPIFLFNAVGTSRRPSVRITNGGLFFACLLIIFLNFSRSALLAVAVITITGFVCIHQRERLKQFLVSTSGTAPVFTVFLSAGTYFILLVTMVLDNPFTYSYGSLWTRWQLVVAATHMLFDTIIGVGIGNFPVYTEGLDFGRDIATAPHNWIIRVLGEFGFVIGTLFIFTIGRLMDALLATYLQNNDPIDIILCLMILAFVFGGMGTSSALSIEVVWIVLGLGIARQYSIKYAFRNR